MDTIIYIPGFEQFKQRGNRFWLKRVGPNNGTQKQLANKTTIFEPERPKENGFKIIKQTGNALVIEVNE